ncbi:hypothetical protein [Micromonospora sp. NPDC023737]|uniref:hypothetical protein n=1 Tax=unclassified Micromonospora TaxID=2617518 RepID=UPI003400DAB5
MLSFPDVHALTSCLAAADADADTRGWGQPITLLLLHDRPPATDEAQREIRSLEFPLHPNNALTDAAGQPALLHHIADELDRPATPYQATLAAILDLIRMSTPNARMLAWAACYPDLQAVDPQLRQARRVDAVDIDGRFYQLTRLHGDDHPVVLVDDTPANNAPPTYHALVALLAAGVRFTQTKPRVGLRMTSTGRRPRSDLDEPIFEVCGPDGASLRCRICGAVDEVTVTELPSMAGYGEDTYVRCSRCGSAETTDPIFGWRAKPATWPPLHQHDQP